MEEKQRNLKIMDNSRLMKNILLNKPKEESVAVASSSDNAKKTEDVKESPPQKAEEEEKPEERVSTPSRNSPEPSCAICLEQLQNKSFTDSCFHTFCFTCLVEWSKVKAECPLCKQRFKSIVYNMRSNKDYDLYYIKSKDGDNIWGTYNERRFRYGTTMTAERILERNRMYQETIESQIASHRMRFAPHSISLYTTAQRAARMPCNFRRRIYDENLWVTRPTSERTRRISPEFYRQHPACTHRLLPWLNRELVALLQNNENQVTFVMELIMALITRYEITSQEFFLHIEPYLAPRTSHFIHEFYVFATSPYDMEGYDRRAIYNSTNVNKVSSGASSPDSDVIPLPSNGNDARATEERASKQKKKHFNRLRKLILKRASENDSWETVVPPVPIIHNYSNMSSSYSTPGPSTSGLNAVCSILDDSSSTLNAVCSILDDNSSTLNAVSSLLDDTSSDISKNPLGEDCSDDECLIIDVVKSKREQTPEIVELSSGEDNSDKVIDVSSGDDNDSSNETVNCFRPSPASPSHDYNCFSNDDECVFLEEHSSANRTKTEKHNFLSKDNKHQGSEPEGSGSRTEPPVKKVTDKSSHLELKKSPERSTVSSNDQTTSSESPSSSPVYYPLGIWCCRNNHHVPPNYTPQKRDLSTPVPPHPARVRTPSGESEKAVPPANPLRKKNLSSRASPSYPSRKRNFSPSSVSPSQPVRKKNIPSSPIAGSSTDSSDNESPSDKGTVYKKLKLRSVVAHFSYDRSGERNDSSHRSSHKRRKEKKKKKKKRTHRHKHRIYSDESD